MKKTLYEVKVYRKGTVFTSQLRLVYRWYIDETRLYTNRKEAVKYFSLHKSLYLYKAVLRIKRK